MAESPAAPTVVPAGLQKARKQLTFRRGKEIGDGGSLGYVVRDPESGQTLAEYAVVVAGIAVVCALAALFLSGAIGGHVRATAEVAGQPHVAPLEPPATPILTWPTTIGQCAAGGWRSFAQFDTEAECNDYVSGLTP